MSVLTIVCTNKNIFLNLHNNNRIIYSKSLGSFNLTIKDLKVGNNTKKIVLDLILFLKKSKIGWLDLKFNATSNWNLIKMINSNLIKNAIFFNSVNITAKQPFNGTRRKKKRRL